MINVPTSTGSVPSPTNVTPMVGEEYLMMAAAQMHKEGRLVVPEVTPHYQPLSRIPRALVTSTNADR